MKKINSELIYEAYEKSRHKSLINKYLPKRFYYTFSLMLLFALIISYFSNKNLIAYFMFIVLYICWLIYELETISKEVNHKIKIDKYLSRYNFEELYAFLGQKDFKIFNIKLYTFNNTNYSQLIYFNYLLSKSEISKTDIINFIEDLKFKTRNYIPITEKSSFNALIALFISLSVLGFDKLFINTKEWTNGAYAGLVFIIIFYIFLLMGVYGFFDFFEKNVKREKNIMDNLIYLLNRDMLKI